MLPQIYDLEQAVDFHSGVYLDSNGDNMKVFVLHESRNDIRKYYNFLTQSGLILIGYNNLRYDYQLLHVVLETVEGYGLDYIEKNIHILLEKLYKRSCLIINNDIDYKEKKLIKGKKVRIAQVDLYLINHYDNKNRRTSLKWLEYSLNLKKIEDLPFEYDKPVPKEFIDKIIEYNINDVIATLTFYNFKSGGKHVMNDALALRSMLSKRHNVNMMNYNDVKVGVTLLGLAISEEMNMSFWDLQQMCRENRQSIAVEIGRNLADYIEFESEPLKAIHKWYSKQVLHVTKEAFTDMNQSRVKDIEKYLCKVEPDYTKGLNKTKKIFKVKKGKEILTKLSLNAFGCQFDLGTGGLHQCSKPGVYLSDDIWSIEDIDGASWYPHLYFMNIAVQSGYARMYGLKFSEAFRKRYHQMYIDRTKIPKINPMNKAYKLSLNGSFGQMLAAFSWLYAPEVGLGVTISGQLTLLMLIERMKLALKDDVQIIQSNTDGVTFRVKRTRLKEFNKIRLNLQDLIKVELEKIEYKQMIIVNVNSYIAQYTNGKCKTKGMLEIDKELHKNNSSRVVQIALYNYYIHNIPLEQTITQHINGINFNDVFENKGIFDYCKGVKTNKGYYYQGMSINGQNLNIEKYQGRVLRYFISNKGIHVTKTNGESNPSNIEAHPQKGKTYYITPFNTHFEALDYDINFQYYMRECRKVTRLTTEKLTLF